MDGPGAVSKTQPSAPGTEAARPPAAARDAPRAGPTPRLIGRVAVLMAFDILPQHRLWGWSRFVLRRTPLRAVRGLRFSKILGSGYEGGFGMSPSASIQGLFCTFDDEADADAFLASPLAAAYRQRAGDWMTVKLRAFATRGSWDGCALQPSAERPENGPLAALTRASIKPGKAAQFWPLAMPSQVSLERAPGCLFAIGLGEAPFLRQATFSVWESVAAMDAYARHGAHQQAIMASRAGDFFSESMFVRFAPIDLRFRWKGRQHG